MGENIKIKKGIFSKLTQLCLQFVLLNCIVFSESLVMTYHERRAVNLPVNP